MNITTRVRRCEIYPHPSEKLLGGSHSQGEGEHGAARSAVTDGRGGAGELEKNQAVVEEREGVGAEELAQ
jgi:hypothetical protein